MRAFGVTDKGNVRKRNEDAILVDETLGLFAVADGMGGHGMGDVAGGMCLDILVRELADADDPENVDAPAQNALPEDDATLCEVPEPMVDAVRGAVEAANAEIYALNTARGAANGRGMGATLAGMKVFDETSRAVVFHVGDSRVYRLRAGRLVRLTRDHSVFEEWKRDGGQGDAPFRNFILRAVGPNRAAVPELSVQAVLPGDVWLACSDGLTGMVSDGDMEKILRGVRPDNIEEAARTLVELAKERGGKDNIGVVLAVG